MPSRDFCKRLLDETGAFLVPGSAFGPEFEGWVRMGFACTSEVLKKGLNCVSTVSYTHLFAHIWRGNILVISNVKIMIVFLAVCAFGIYLWWMREIPLSIDSKVWTGSFLTGRPDAVIKKGPWVIPVEFKSCLLYTSSPNANMQRKKESIGFFGLLSAHNAATRIRITNIPGGTTKVPIIL